MQVDVVIFGGGAAGLWLLDELHRHGRGALLLEADRLGAGQTIASQGIIHGGLKYALRGLLTASARNIREMPALWRDCLAGNAAPDLSRTPLRSSHCWLWQTETVRSRLGMLGARLGLQATARTVPAEERPAVLANCPGPVAQLEEQVLSPAGFLADLADRHQPHLLRIDPAAGLRFDTTPSGHVESVHLRNPENGAWFELRPSCVVLTAGAGNAELRRRSGRDTPVMQRRPLHMVMLRGALPALCGHCVDGARTRVTITSDVDAAGRTVWQVGGHLAEAGVEQEPAALLAHARRELEAVLPGLEISGIEAATYRVDRAEGVVSGGGRPDDVQLLCEENVVTAWPTKLALVPRLSRQITERLAVWGAGRPVRLPEWPRPRIAAPPWETCPHWQRFDETFPREKGDRNVA